MLSLNQGNNYDFMKQLYLRQFQINGSIISSFTSESVLSHGNIVGQHTMFYKYNWIASISDRITYQDGCTL